MEQRFVRELFGFYSLFMNNYLKIYIVLKYPDLFFFWAEKQELTTLEGLEISQNSQYDGLLEIIKRTLQIWYLLIDAYQSYFC